MRLVHKNVIHSHTNQMHGLVYIMFKQREQEILCLHNPANILLIVITNSPFTRKTGIQPKDGMLVLWPGWVPHEVIENKSNKQRINLAWGVNFI